MTKEPTIIALSGRKGGGKNTLSSFILEHYQYHIAAYKNTLCEEMAFADGIKDFCIDILGLDYDQCYGSDDDKNTPTEYKWENTPQFHHGWDGSKYMSGREVMQIYGTESVRAWFGNVWAEATVRKIQKMDLGCAIVTDNRFPDEVETILGQPKGYIIRLTRSPYDGNDLHSSETALDDFDWDRPNCFVLDNAHMNKKEQKIAAIPILETIFSQGAGV